MVPPREEGRRNRIGPESREKALALFSNRFSSSSRQRRARSGFLRVKTGCSADRPHSSRIFPASPPAEAHPVVPPGPAEVGGIDRYLAGNDEKALAGLQFEVLSGRLKASPPLEDAVNQIMVPDGRGRTDVRRAVLAAALVKTQRVPSPPPRKKDGG